MSSKFKQNSNTSLLLISFSFFGLQIASANEVKDIAESYATAVLSQAEGEVQVLVPVVDVEQAKDEVRATIDGKIYSVVNGVSGMQIPNGAVLKTIGESKAKILLENGSSFVAGKSTEMAMIWQKDVVGKAALDIKVKEGLVRGIVGAKDDLNVNLVTSSFRAAMKNAEFITGTIEDGKPLDVAKGSMLKMIHGDTRVQQLSKFSKLKNKEDVKELVAQAGSDLVMGVKDFKAIPILQTDALRQATSLLSKVEDLKNTSKDEWVKRLTVDADMIAAQVGAQAGPPPDNCGCPTLEQRLKRAAIKSAQAKILDSKSKSEAQVNNQAQSEKKEEGPLDSEILGKIDPMTELSCMSPIVSQLKGAAQIIKSLKEGVFSSKEAKEGDCVSNNSLFKSFTDARSAFQFPNGDELFSSDKTDMLVKWTKNKLDLKTDQGSVRGIFKEAKGRLVNLESQGLKVATKAGDLQVAASKAAVNAAAGAAPAAATAAAGLASSAVSVFSGLANVGGKVLTAGTQLSAGSNQIKKLSADEINQLQSQTMPPRPTEALTSAAATAAAQGAVSAGATAGMAAVDAGTAALGAGVGSALGATYGAVSGASSAATSAAEKVTTAPKAAVDGLKKSVDQPLKKMKTPDLKNEAGLLEKGLFKSVSDQPEEEFIKKYLNF